MQLNYDCVRDVMLKLEELLTIEYKDYFDFSSVSIGDIHKSLLDKKYSIEDIFYTVHNLYQANYIEANTISFDDELVEYVIFNITFEGHQFLQNIRPKMVWDKSKSVIKNIGTISIDIIKSVSSTVISDTIKHYLPGYFPQGQTP